MFNVNARAKRRATINFLKNKMESISVEGHGVMPIYHYVGSLEKLNDFIFGEEKLCLNDMVLRKELAMQNGHPDNYEIMVSATRTTSVIPNKYGGEMEKLFLLPKWLFAMQNLHKFKKACIECNGNHIVLNL
jgi:hypothetical protein